MTKKDLARLAGLSLNCKAALTNKARQSMTIFRGDMWAIFAAYKQIQKQQAGVIRKAKPHEIE